MASVQLFIGGLTRIPEHGQSTGIYKCTVAGPLDLAADGLRGDVQADRRVHGGPDKAVHHYAAENYPLLAARLPTIADQLVPGSIGENVSTTGFDESGVCIGDIFVLGRAVLQVSQPRSPCWKIDHRYACDGVARLIAETGLTGWYYRVLEPAAVCSGEELELSERLTGAVSLQELWRLWREHRPDPAELARVAAAPGLTAAWRRKLLDRCGWLRNAAATILAPASRTGRD
ncbi:MOSC domain-containing protein [Accumulibacter sp.]|uniref:MOSC domain-containing protein n=1 Tax=Accumulibacter sp. TaxID=2053492 RepID=UPI002C675C01|nr:MOSC domain-containing protein [Accumulibacter sp.]HNC22546.1 MOSC domain-containing protein [Accumulibacter sp.]